MSTIKQIQALVRNGLYYLTEHADDEAIAEDFDILSPSTRIGPEDEERTMTTGFWEGETCEYCGGLIVEKRVNLARKTEGKYVFIENVPAGVCTECGTRYYAANVLKTVEETARGRRKADLEVLVPVYSYAV